MACWCSCTWSRECWRWLPSLQEAGRAVVMACNVQSSQVMLVVTGLLEQLTMYSRTCACCLQSPDPEHEGVAAGCHGRSQECRDHFLAEWVRSALAHGSELASGLMHCNADVLRSPLPQGNVPSAGRYAVQRSASANVPHQWGPHNSPQA